MRGTVRAFAGVSPGYATTPTAGPSPKPRQRTLPAMIQHAEVPAPEAALTELQEVHPQDGTSHAASRRRGLRDLRSEVTRRLLPQGSDEPEAARPR